MIAAQEVARARVRQRVGIALLVLSLLAGAAARSPAAADPCAEASAAIRALSGCAALRGGMGFVRPPAKIFAADPYAAYLKTIEGLLTTKARATAHQRYSGKVIVCFHIGPDGHVSNRDLCQKNGNPTADRFALAVVASLGQLPPPPPSTTSGGVVWVYTFDDEPRRRTRAHPSRSEPASK